MANILIKVSQQDLVSLLITAVESGISYWAERKPKSYDPDKGRVIIREHNDERDVRKRGPWIQVTTGTIARGLQLCSRMPSDEGGWAFPAWLKDRTGDANIADIIFQFGALRELKYG